MDPLCFKPLENRIVVRRSEERERISGLYVPAGAADIPTEGTVMAVGPGLVIEGKLIKPTLRPGDDVLFGKYSGSSFEHEKQTYLVMRESEVLGIIDRDAASKTDVLADALKTSATSGDPFYDTDKLKDERKKAGARHEPAHARAG